MQIAVLFGITSLYFWESIEGGDSSKEEVVVTDLVGTTRNKSLGKFWWSYFSCFPIKSGVELSCTLWGHFATTLFNYRRIDAEPTVVIIKHVRIKDGSVSNTWNGTKLFINFDYDDSKKFATSLPADFAVPANLSTDNIGSSQMMSQGPAGTQLSGSNRFWLGFLLFHFPSSCLYLRCLHFDSFCLGSET
ncbi:hypothetical protein QL285_042540 [Trifolium repens]|nr:hypothetical protein QL285_042540 [Trifolium repens]